MGAGSIFQKGRGPLHYTSRSAIELYRRCPRLRYLNSYYQGVGISPKGNAVPLVTGTTVHEGIGAMLLAAATFNDVPEELFLPHNFHMMLQTGINVATKQYQEILSKAGFTGEKVATNRQQEFKVAEQMCLAQALMYVWAYYELPPLMQEYKIDMVEQEIEAMMTKRLTMQVRADAILQSRENENRYVVYSLKTNNRWTPRLENVYKYSTQGITEYWGAVQHYAPKGKTIEGVKFCHLIKGTEREDTDSALDPSQRVWYTDCPLTRGWRRLLPTHTEYAHSFWFPNPNNKSGRGRLSNNYERFYVWENMGVSSWWTMIHSGQVQPEIDNPALDMRISPPVYWKDENRVKRTMIGISSQEEEIIENVRLCHSEAWDGVDMTNYPYELDHKFRQNFDACWFPTECPMVPVCHDASVAWNPLASGLYQIRVPHHEPERKANERTNNTTAVEG